MPHFIHFQLLNDEIRLDTRPEFARATIISKEGRLYAEISGNQISSRLKSISNADVLLHLPASTSAAPSVKKGAQLSASVLKHDFISRYE
jgi:gephyrin